jgi:hypothetical protein
MKWRIYGKQSRRPYKKWKRTHGKGNNEEKEAADERRQRWEEQKQALGIRWSIQSNNGSSNEKLSSNGTQKRRNQLR